MPAVRPYFRSLTEIYIYLRSNTTPTRPRTSCLYDLLGSDHWIGNSEYISYFNTLEIFHPRDFTLRETARHEFSSIEDIGNYILGNDEVVAHFQAGGKTDTITAVIFDGQTEALVKTLGFKMAVPSNKPRTYIHSKITTTGLGNEAGVPSVPPAAPQRPAQWQYSKLF